jgi:Transposase zinc-binding domain
MTRPLLEVADIVRAQGDRFIHSNFRWVHWAHRKVLRAIARCRTAALGGHRDQCPRCGYRTTSYNSCRDRHCPKCQSGARDKWIMARQNELLPVAYVHVVSLSLTNSPHWRCRTRRSSMTSCSAPVPRPYRRSPEILATWEPTSASFRSCIPGGRTYCIILTSTVSFPPGASRPTVPGGSIPATPASALTPPQLAY